MLNIYVIQIKHNTEINTTLKNKYMRIEINKTEKLLILNILKYIETKENKYKVNAIENIKKISEYFHHTICRKKVRISLLDALYKLLENKDGYPDNLDNLYNLLL